MKIQFDIPVKTVSLTNQREHWAVKAERAKRQRAAAHLKSRNACKGQIKPLIQVTMVRYGVRTMDYDNLCSALKSIRDGIASSLKVDDGSPLIDWVYAQDQGEPRVEVTVEAV